MILIRALLAAGALALIGAIVWAVGGSGAFGDEVAWLVSRPWGVVSLIDLYLCFFALSVIVWLTEANKTLALAVILPTFVLGGLVPALWLVWRAPLIARRLSRA